MTPRIEENGCYKCSKCNTFTVDREGEYSRTGFSYSEKWFNTYTCEHCKSECTIVDDDDFHELGNTIYFED